ncbi:zinc ribbon domain-containing protein [Desulfonema ishimotonii]|uniref:Zinc ribbon domain-containing protein n=1 Tax=Desulfonema ishimotonii TaxID=45657 RepID=A0A401FVT2_9BACT|nr:zinc ribbon domain-containing protein [Desulfonema ishimotonii]GBC61092.1 zinc ribbon domain-containing protein [Desulfonema ishimotonii]
MAIETKEQYFERMMEQEKPKCPHCGEEMSIWEVPPVSFSDGLGWGAPYLFVCFNDDCSLYKEGWAEVEANFGHRASYRCMCYLGTEEKFECMPVFSPQGATGQVIDDQAVLQQEMLKENIKKGFSILADCYVNRDGVTILRLLLDSAEPARVRLKAAEMIGDIGSLEAIDPIRNAKFGSEPIQDQVNKSIKKIHERHFTRECPFCAEIIKKQAKICKHCGKEVAGE